MSTPIRWGILGAGIIAHKLAEAVGIDPNSQLVAVASNTPGKAESFVKKTGTNIDSHTNYQDLVARRDIDVVYVATTHNLHFENTLLALNNDKHVLVEKPFTVNAQQAQTLANVARDRKLFLMEAVWVRFLPSIIKLKKLLQNGVIGELKCLNLSFGVPVGPDFLPRLKDPNLAGGVTLDMGIYPITFTNFMLGMLPEKVHSICIPSKTGVDELATYQFEYSNGCLASIATSYSLPTKIEAMIYGTEGYIEFPGFQQGETFTIHTHKGTGEILSSETITTENHKNGFIYQVAEVVDCIRSSKNESETIPLNETIATMNLMDTIREDLGIKYPFE